MGRKTVRTRKIRPDEEDTTIFHGGEATRSKAVVFLGRLWQTMQEISVAVIAALAVLQGVVDCGEKLEPPRDSRIVISYFADAFERLVIREHAKLRAPYVASKAFDGADNAARFYVKRSPVPLRIEGSAADERDAPH